MTRVLVSRHVGLWAFTVTLLNYEQTVIKTALFCIRLILFVRLFMFWSVIDCPWILLSTNQVTKSRWNLRYMVSILKWATPVFFMRHPVYPCILSMLATENVHCMKYKWKLKSQSIESITLNQASDVLHMNSNNTMFIVYSLVIISRLMTIKQYAIIYNKTWSSILLHDIQTFKSNILY